MLLLNWHLGNPTAIHNLEIGEDYGKKEVLCCK